MLAAGLWRRRGTVGLATLAIAIGASVASALFHVSADVSGKLGKELRALGPNLIVVPADAGPDRYLMVADTRARLVREHVAGVPLLLVSARAHGAEIPIVGADLDAARALHPSWRITGTGTTLIGARLASRLDMAPGTKVTIEGPGGRTIALAPGARLDAGGPEDDAWWIPLADAQALAGLPERASLFQARLPQGVPADAVTARLESGGGLRALPLHALTATEAGLLARTRSLMTLVTLAAFLAAGLCAFGTLADLALERRRDVGLLKALGAAPGAIARALAAESLAIGIAGGIAGWAIGLLFAELIGLRVFHAAIAPRWDVPLLVTALSGMVAALAGLWPIRVALAAEPARVLQGD